MHKRLPLFFILIVILLTAACQSGRDSTDEAGGQAAGTVRPDPIPVTFATLNADPFTFLNRVVRVTGVFRTNPPVGCFPFVGPNTTWRMIADGFELPVNGLSAVGEIAPEGLVLTIDGIWRQYEGPYGCAPEPDEQTFWYLEASQLVSPNPLGGGGGIPIGDLTNTPTPVGGSVLGTPTVDTGLLLTPLPTSSIPTPSSTPNVTISPVPTFTPTEEAPFGLPSPTIDPFVTPSGTPQGTATPTPGPTSTGTITATPTPTVFGTAGPSPTPIGGSGSGTRNPATPAPTNTPTGGYPGTNPTPTQGSYP